MYQGPPVYTTVSRTVPRHVRCEHCGEEFVYELARSGVGQAGYGLGGTEEAVYRQAAEAALADLDRQLATGAEAVPCPACHRYQRHMAATARALQWGWVRGLGAQGLLALPVACVLAVMVAVVGFPQHPRLPVLLAAGVAGVLLLAGLVALVAFRLTPCDPDRWSPAFRAQQAAALALTRADFALASVAGGPFSEDLTAGREADYEGVLFLWVLPEEIAGEEVVPLVLAAGGREVDVELSEADHDGVFLHEDRVDDPGGGEYRICLRVFDVYRPAAAPSRAESE